MIRYDHYTDKFVKVSDRECPWCKAVCATTNRTTEPITEQLNERQNMKYKAGDKFIIEIETHYSHSGEKNSTRPLNDSDGADVSTLYRVRGFKSLVFDEAGLNKLCHVGDDLTAEEYLNIKRYYCKKQFEKGWRVTDLPDWCLEDFRYPENAIEQIEHLRGEYKKAKYEADRMADIRYDLEDVIAEYGIEDIRKALDLAEREGE